MSARSARVGGGRTNEAAATAGARSMSGPETKPETKTTGRQTGRQHANQYNRKFAEVHKQSEMAQSLSGSHKATATTMNVRDIMLHSARKEWDPGYDVEDINRDGHVSAREHELVTKLMDIDHDGVLDAEEKDLLRQITKNPQEAALHPTVSVNAMDLDGDGIIDEAEEALFRSIADVDGDGVVDARDIYLAKIQFKCNKITHADVVDLSGDGKISDLELRHAREDAGRKYVVEDFINRNRNVMSEYNPLFKQMSHAEQRAYLCREYQDRTSFADVHKELEEREHVMARSTSNQVRHCLTRVPRPKTAADAPGYGTHGKVRKQADGPWARRLMTEEAELDTHGYETARRAHEKRLERCFTPRVPQHERPNAYGTRFSKDKGNIPGYGNFSTFGSFMVKATGKTFSNTR